MMKFKCVELGRCGRGFEFDFDYLRTSGDEVCFYVDGECHCIAKVYYGAGHWKLDWYDRVSKNPIDMPVRKVLDTWGVV